MKYFLILGCLLLSLQSRAQQANTRNLQDSAKNFVQQGEYKKAVAVLERAILQEPDNPELQKDLAFVLYLQKEYDKALETIKPLLDKREADELAYQVAGMIYLAKEDIVEGEKLYKKGIKRFPGSGELYSEYGDLLWYKQDNNAIRQWEKGMEVEPNYPANYYNAARYYFNNDKVWSIIYGEIFVNMESYSLRTIEIKNLILESYKKLLTDPDLMKSQANKNAFVAAYLNTLSRQSSVIAGGVTPESLTMLRARFVLDWNDKYAAKYPFLLFEYQRQLLKEGLFDAYNQWLFGPIQNLTAFQNWTNKHAESYTEFISFQHDRVFKLPSGQNYQTKKD
jgi:tetratricopeptide (TPR) repeat protein